MKERSEFSYQCDMCKSKRDSRIFYTTILGQWRYLCPECWEIYNKKIADELECEKKAQWIHRGGYASNN